MTASDELLKFLCGYDFRVEWEDIVRPMVKNSTTELADLRAAACGIAEDCPYLKRAEVAEKRAERLEKAANKALEWFAQYPFENKAFEGNSAAGLYHELNAILEAK